MHTGNVNWEMKRFTLRPDTFTLNFILILFCRRVWRRWLTRVCTTSSRMSTRTVAGITARSKAATFSAGRRTASLVRRRTPVPSCALCVCCDVCAVCGVRCGACCGAWCAVRGVACGVVHAVVCTVRVADVSSTCFPLLPPLLLPLLLHQERSFGFTVTTTARGPTTITRRL